MKNKLYLLAIGLGVIAMVLGLTAIAAKSSATLEPMSRKIVVFHPGFFVNEAAEDELINRVGGVKIKNLDLIGGKAVYLPSKAAEKALARQAGVLRIDDDVIVEALARGGISAKPAPTQPAEVLPW